jgi:hypothetical protein
VVGKPRRHPLMLLNIEKPIGESGKVEKPQCFVFRGIGRPAFLP